MTQREGGEIWTSFGGASPILKQKHEGVGLFEFSGGIFRSDFESGMSATVDG